MDSIIFFFGKEFCIGGRNFACIVLLEPSHTFCTVGLCHVGEAVNFLAGEFSAAFDIDGTDRAAICNRISKYTEAGVGQNVAEVLQLKAKTDIGLVRAEAIHGFLIRHTDKVLFHIDVVELTHQIFDKAFVHSDNIVLHHKGHFGVDLGKFRLTVCTEVLIAVATGDLEITVKAGEHQQLLIQLRRLGQSIELTGMHTAGHQIVSCAFGSGLDQVGGFNVNETAVCIVVSCQLGDFRAVHNVLLHIRTAQVKETVAQTHVGTDRAVFYDFKGRGLRSGKNLQLIYCHFNFPGGQVFVDRPFTARAYYTFSAKHELRTNPVSHTENVGVGLFVKGQLDNTAAVTKVDENQCAQVALLLHPTHHAYSLTNLLFGQLCTVGCAFVILLQVVCHFVVLLYMSIIHFRFRVYLWRGFAPAALRFWRRAP